MSRGRAIRRMLATGVVVLGAPMVLTALAIAGVSISDAVNAPLQALGVKSDDGADDRGPGVEDEHADAASDRPDHVEPRGTQPGGPERVSDSAPGPGQPSSRQAGSTSPAAPAENGNPAPASPSPAPSSAAPAPTPDPGPSKPASSSGPVGDALDQVNDAVGGVKDEVGGILDGLNGTLGGGGR